MNVLMLLVRWSFARVCSEESLERETRLETKKLTRTTSSGRVKGDMVGGRGGRVVDLGSEVDLVLVRLVEGSDEPRRWWRDTKGRRGARHKGGSERSRGELLQLV